MAAGRAVRIEAVGSVEVVQRRPVAAGEELVGAERVPRARVLGLEVDRLPVAAERRPPRHPVPPLRLRAPSAGRPRAGSATGPSARRPRALEIFPSAIALYAESTRRAGRVRRDQRVERPERRDRLRATATAAARGRGAARRGRRGRPSDEERRRRDGDELPVDVDERVQGEGAERRARAQPQPPRSAVLDPPQRRRPRRRRPHRSAPSRSRKPTIPVSRGTGAARLCGSVVTIEPTRMSRRAISNVAAPLPPRAARPSTATRPPATTSSGCSS